MQVPFGIALRDAEHFTDFPVRISFHGKQIEYGGRGKRQLLEHLQQIVPNQFLIGQRLAWHLTGIFHWFVIPETAVGPHVIHRGIYHDPFHPAGEITIPAILIDARQDVEKRLVQDVRRVAAVTGIAQAQAQLRLVTNPVQLLLCRSLLSPATFECVFWYAYHARIGFFIR